jgi:hypothetical protein
MLHDVLRAGLLAHAHRGKAFIIRSYHCRCLETVVHAPNVRTLSGYHGIHVGQTMQSMDFAARPHDFERSMCFRVDSLSGRRGDACELTWHNTTF